jgi:hypothetical protein
MFDARIGRKGTRDDTNLSQQPVGHNNRIL